MACYGAGSAKPTINLPPGTVDINGDSTLDCCYCAGGNPPPGELPILTCTDPTACNYNQVGTCIFPGTCDRYIRIRAGMNWFADGNGDYIGTCGDYIVSATCAPGLPCAELVSITDAFGGQDYVSAGQLRHYNYRIPANSSAVTFRVDYFNTNGDLCRKLVCGPSAGDVCEARNNPICNTQACDNASPTPGPVDSSDPGCPGHGGVILAMGEDGPCGVNDVYPTVGIFGYSDINNTCYEEYLVPLVANISPCVTKTCECPSLVP